MKIISHNSYTRKNSILRKINLMIILLIFLSSSFLILNSNNITEIDKDFDNFSQIPLLADDSPILFEGNEKFLNITDYGNLYKYDQEVSLTNQEEHNLTYYLDDVHGWKVNKVQTSISNIQDTRDWITSSDFEHFNLTSYRVIQVYDSGPFYGNNEDKGSSLESFIVTGAIAIRLHFDKFEFEDDYDFFIIEDENNTRVYQDTDFQYDFFSPWVRGDEIQFYMETDGNTFEYGYYIDYYEYVTGNSTLSPWQEDTNALIQTYYGYGFIENSSAMSVSLLGDIDPSDTYWVDYYDNEYELLYQDLTVPRGAVVDASFSFDYYAHEAINTNDFTIFAAINGQKIYSLGFGDVVDLGRKTWHSTGDININLWVNSTQIFNPIINNQQLNFSLGIKTGNGASYGGYEDRYQQIFSFDNISLILTTIANSTQNDINLKIEGGVVKQGNEWGSSNETFTNLWDTNPIILKVNTTSPSLSFETDTTVYGHHNTTSRLGQTTNEEVSYEILENGTIYWEFSHNFYMPAQYSDFEFIISKPKNWEFISALDPTLQEIPFEDGKVGDTTLKINTSYAIFPGWWTFRATSPNYLNQSNTKILKQGEWTHISSFTTGESTIIKTQLNHSNDVLVNLGSTEVNLTVYDPEGVMWFTETQTPFSNGSVFFSELYFDALTTTGGQYDYTLFWSNGTALGGLNSSFLVIHESSFSLIKPNDAISDSITDAFIGDIIPVQVNLTDSDNNDPILNAIISYNWTSGTVYFEEASLGIYETILDTSDLGSNGFYEILIESLKVGFLDYNLTLKINLGEETNVQRLQSDYNIELHANSTIKFRYYSLLDDVGIDGANVDVNISNPDFFNIENSPGGYYDIEFDTSFTDNLGIKQLNFNFSATSFEPQTHIYQFEIVEQSVNITAYVDNVEIQQNSIIDITYMEEINISTQARALIDDDLLTGGNFTWKINTYEQTLNEYSNFWYNTSIQINPSIYSPGLNLIGIQFEMEKYQTDIFYFQLLVSEQPVNLSVFINSHQISEDQLVEVMFRQDITISTRAYGKMDLNFIDEAYISLNSESYTTNFIEYGANWYNLSLTFSATNFSSGINTISIKFEKQNYTTTFFTFQFFITAETVNLSLYVDSQEIVANSLIEITYFDELSLSLRALANVEKLFLDEGSAIFAIGSYNQEFTQNANYWYNTSVICDLSKFDLGINSAYVRFLHPNYTSSTFYFQILVNQIEMNVNTIDFQDSIESYSGESLVIRINLTEFFSDSYIENATISYSWEFGLGTFEEVGNGIYEIELEIPDNIHGSFKVSLIISTENVLYKTTQSSFLLVIGEPQFPIFLIWIIIIISALIISALGVLSLRSYVILPKRRIREAELLARTQRFKDLQNIQAIVVIHRYSGIPLYSKSYSILEKHKKELFSGFVQAIITVGEEMTGKRGKEGDLIESDEEDGSRTILELDFKYFYCLICDRQDLRIIFILTERASDRLKKVISDLSLGAMLELSEQIENWDGAIHDFEVMFPPIINKYVELYFKETFKINNAKFIAKLRKEVELNSMETRILNVLYSIAKSKTEFYLENIFSIIHEKNRDIVIDGIEGLIKKQVIIPSTK